MLDPVVLTPAHDFTLGDPQLLGRGDMFFAADGRFYAQSYQIVFNAWNFFAYYWPETLGVILALTLLLALTACEHIRRRPRQVGALHCRRCNYNVSGLPAGAPCAECGADLARHRPVLGRSRRRRLAAPIAIGVIASACYAALHAAGVPRGNPANSFLYWPLPGLAKVIRERGILWLMPFNELQSTLVEIDPVSGEVVRRVCGLDARPMLPLSPSPDGRLVVAAIARDTPVAIDLRSGQTVARLESPYRVVVPAQGLVIARWSQNVAGWSHVVGWLGEQTLLVQFVDQNTPRSTVYRWDIRSGELAEIADVPTASVTTPSPMVWAATLWLVPGADPPIAIEVPTKPEEQTETYGASSTIRVREMLPGGRTVREISGAFWPRCAPVLRADGSGFFIGMQGEYGVGLWSLADGSWVGGLAEKGFQSSGAADDFGGLAFHNPSHRLFANSYQPFSVRVRDTDANAWIADLKLPSDCMPAGRVVVSPDGRFAAINVAEDLDGSNSPAAIQAHKDRRWLGIGRRLLIFDLSSLDHRPGEPTP